MALSSGLHLYTYNVGPYMLRHDLAIESQDLRSPPIFSGPAGITVMAAVPTLKRFSEV